PPAEAWSTPPTWPPRRSTLSTRGPRWRRSPVAITRRLTGSARTPSWRTPVAPAMTWRWCAAGASRSRARPGSASSTRATSPASPPWTCAAWARAAARSPGSTRAACCTWARRAPRPIRGPSATRGAAPSRPAPTPLGLDANEAAAAIMAVATERMIQSIEEITVNQGVDPRTAVLIGGGGAAGLNAVAIARRLGSPRVVIPQAGAVLSARGALMSDLMSEYATAFFAGSDAFDHARAGEILEELRGRCLRFAERSRVKAEPQIEYVAEARYRHQVWQIDVPLHAGLDAPEGLGRLIEDFHSVHEEIYAVRDERAVIEVVNLRARVTCPLGGGVADTIALEPAGAQPGAPTAYFSRAGAGEAAILCPEGGGPGMRGPCSPRLGRTPGATAEHGARGSLVIPPQTEALARGRAHARVG